MAILKPNKKALDAKVRQLSKLKDELRQAKNVAEGAGSNFWVSMKRKLKDTLGALDNELDNFQPKTNDQIRQILQSRLDFKSFFAMTEDAEVAVERIGINIERLEKEIEENRARI